MDLTVIYYSIGILGILGLLAAVVLYVVAQKFKVEEDSRIEQVEGVLPQANCGGCGFPGCHGFATHCVQSDSMDGLLCPVGGQPVMSQIAEILGRAAVAADPMVAVVRCNGTCEARPRNNRYDGTQTCQIVHSLYIGETGCGYGCLGCGDCVRACQFDAIHINPTTGIAEVDEEKCTSCGACVKACPRTLIELRKKGPKNRRMVVMCRNMDKGAVAKKACANACIGCMKCQKVCAFDAITIDKNLSYIDFTKCKLCRKCEEACPTGAIHAVNFPPRKPKTEAPAAPKAETAAKPAVATEKPIVAPKAPAAEAAPTAAAAPVVTEAPAKPDTTVVTSSVETAATPAAPAEPTNK